MNDHESDHQELIDLLAENELDAIERQSLFETLDQVPGGWKRCALALLETRALQLSLDGVGANALDLASIRKPLKPVDLEQPGRQKPRYFRWILAAALLVSVGFLLGDRSNSKTGVRSTDSQRSVTEPDRHASQDSTFLQLAKQDPELIRQLAFDPNSIGGSDVHLVAYFGTQENDRAKIYPIVESEELSRQLESLATPSLPASLTEKLKQNGWEVGSQKQILSIPMPNGNRKSVPVGTLNYRYVGHQTY